MELYDTLKKYKYQILLLIVITIFIFSNNSNNVKLINYDNKYTDKNTLHSYINQYDKILRKLKNKKINVIEIGCFQGGSIKLWHDYFEKATIYGCDIEDNIKLKEIKNDDRINLYLNEDAYNKEYVNKYFKDKKFDFMLDDGPHTLESQKKFIELYLPMLTDNGIFVIEDIQDIKHIKELTEVTPEEYRNYIKVYDLRENKGRYDDILFTIDKLNF